MTAADRIIRLSDVIEMVSVSRSHIDRLERKGSFPRRLKLGLRRVGWRESEVMAWISERARRSAG